ncbi:sensor histidine kinase [Streptomyces kunmingensis]|uniref:histidine kinase n=1 Tax=Streptomyces kunmingensis TaxID=68225 RepID=A0ABU6CEF0_9ACTN|nr:sensor histidine kinase [Streptomyces kunmingensis]MEB3962760.1 sensor histidine kinase [Streptomyces kunmingensis]
MTSEARRSEPRTSQFLHRTTRRVRAFDRRRPLAWDLLLTGFFVLAAYVDYVGDGWKNIAADTHVPGWLVLLLSLALSVPLLWRRTHPMAALTVMAAAGIVNSATGAVLQAAMLQLFAVFNVALRARMRTLLLACALTMVPVVVAVIRYPRGSWDAQVVPHFWALALVCAFGIAIRSRQDYTNSLVERARRLEVERDQQAQLAAAAERTRIAREMHDIIGHNLSVITGLADGGSYAAARNPERAAQALTAIATTSRQALTELRRLLDVLREETPATGPELAPQPALADIDALVDGVRTAGLPVHLTHTGTPPAPLPSGTQLALYRVLQEALTNALKHAGPQATARADLSYAPDAVTLTVTDTGRGGSPDTGGRGLTGMRERTSLYGGTLEAGPRPSGGWRVTAHLPVPKEPTT